MAAAWLAFVLWIVGDRLIHDIRNRRLDWATQALRDPQLSVLQEPARTVAINRILKRLPLHSLEALMTTSLPAWARDACSLRIERLRNPERLLATARSGPEGTRTWDYIAALSVLANARHPESHALLTRALSAEDLHIRNAAIALFGQIGDRHSAEALIAGLEAAGPLRARIASQLDRFQVPIGDLLGAATASADPDVRSWGAQLMWRYAGTPDFDAQLAKLARDSDAGVRKAAIQSLAEATSPLAASTARGLLHDEAPFVRAHAARALTRSDPENAATDIAPLLADTDWWVRQAVKESLSQLGMPAMPQILKQLESTDRFARNGAADILQEIGTIPLLVERSRLQGPEGAEAEALLERIMHAGERAGTQSHPSWQAPGAGAETHPEERS